MYWALRVWASFLPVLVSEAEKSGWAFVRARFRHLVYEISFASVWARFRQLVDEMSLTNMGRVLQVLMSGAVKCGRGLAGLFKRRVWQILGKVLSALMSKFVKCGRGFAGLLMARVWQILGKVLPVLMSETVKSGWGLAGLFITKFDKYWPRFCQCKWVKLFNVGQVSLE